MKNSSQNISKKFSKVKLLQLTKKNEAAILQEHVITSEYERTILQTKLLTPRNKVASKIGKGIKTLLWQLTRSFYTYKYATPLFVFSFNKLMLD